MTEISNSVGYKLYNIKKSFDGPAYSLGDSGVVSLQLKDINKRNILTSLRKLPEL